MATLYYKHDRRLDLVELGTVRDCHYSFRIPTNYTKEDVHYICVVYEQKVYAGRHIIYGTGGHHGLITVDFSDSETGKQILLKHFLQGD